MVGRGQQRQGGGGPPDDALRHRHYGNRNHDRERQPASNVNAGHGEATPQLRRNCAANQLRRLYRNPEDQPACYGIPVATCYLAELAEIVCVPSAIVLIIARDSACSCSKERPFFFISV